MSGSFHRRLQLDDLTFEVCDSLSLLTLRLFLKLLLLLPIVGSLLLVLLLLIVRLLLAMSQNFFLRR
jgi:hypothetical protein